LSFALLWVDTVKSLVASPGGPVVSDETLKGILKLVASLAIAHISYLAVCTLAEMGTAASDRQPAALVADRSFQLPPSSMVLQTKRNHNPSKWGTVPPFNGRSELG
jgi:hypothetical protein